MWSAAARSSASVIGAPTLALGAANPYIPKVRLLLPLFCAGCVVTRAPAWFTQAVPSTMPDSVGEAVYAGLVTDGEKAFADRADAARLTEALAAFRAALRYRPEDVHVLTLAARAALCEGAAKFGEKGLPQLEQAVAWAERALALGNEKLAAKARAKAPPEAIFALAEEADAAALTVYAEALFAWADRAGTPTLMDQQERIRAAAERALALDRAASHAAADRVLGALLSSLPNAAGADLFRAREHFEAAVARAPGYLPTLVEYAERWAIRERDGGLEKKLLEQVMSANADALADAVAENRGAQAAAKKLLGR